MIEPPLSRGLGPEPRTLRPRRGRFRLRALALALPLVLACGGSIAPRADTLTDLILPESQEKQLAEQEHPKVVAEFGGEYRDPKLTPYIDSLVTYLGQVSDRPDIHYRVTILNSPVVNAFALPAGYVYVTRGLLALANNEAEIAGVLGHEIGHITARHVAQRYSRTILAQGIVGLLGALTKGTAYQGLGNLAEPLAAVALQSYSREQENEADSFGVKYMSRAGYDPYGMASFLSSLEAETKLQATLTGSQDPDRFDLMATHPRTVDRVVETIKEAKLERVTQPMTEHRLYLEKIDGILYGDDPAQGFVRGRVFAHPRLGFRFEVPEGFTLLNGADQVIAQGQGQALIRFDQAKLDGDRSAARYLRDVWVKGQPIANLETPTINGFPAATGTARLQQDNAPLDLRFVAIKTAPRTICRFLFVTAPDLTARYADAFKRTTYSFRALTEAERAQLKPYRIKVVTVRPGDTVARLAERLPYLDHKLERFQVLNGLKPGEQLKPGDVVKLVVEG
jgi:predicted Zn-dependent protease